MSNPDQLVINGEVDRPLTLTFNDLDRIDDEHRVRDVSRLDAKRKGDGVQLSHLLKLASVRDSAEFIGLHGTLDNFHASVPLEPLRERAILVYRLNDEPLSVKDGGPFRFFIPDSAACHTEMIDECANVKFVDHIELTRERGFDNRPQDDEEHEHLHRQSDS